MHLVGFIIRIYHDARSPELPDPACKLCDIYNCCMYSEKLLMMDRGTVRNMFRPNPARKLSANPYDIYHCCMYSEKLLMMDRGTVRNMFLPDPARKLSANLYDIYRCSVYSEKLLTMGRGTVRKMDSFIPKINLSN